MGPLASDLRPASSERGHFQLSLACQRGRETDLTAAQSTAREAKHRTISKSTTVQSTTNDKLREWGGGGRTRQAPRTQNPSGPTTQQAKVPEGLIVQTDKRPTPASGDRRGQSHRGLGGTSAQERGQLSSFKTRANFTKQHSNKTQHRT